MARKPGRPSDYTLKLTDKICERLADGESLRSICSSDGMPRQTTVFRWLAAHAEFRERYARAREAQADALFDECLEIADDARNDWMVKNGKDSVGWELNGEHVQRSKLRIDARRWMAAKLQPKRYGDKVEVEQTGTLTIVTKEQRDAAVAAATRADA